VCLALEEILNSNIHDRSIVKYLNVYKQTINILYKYWNWKSKTKYHNNKCTIINDHLPINKYVINFFSNDSTTLC